MCQTDLHIWMPKIPTWIKSPTEFTHQPRQLSHVWPPTGSRTKRVAPLSLVKSSTGQMVLRPHCKGRFKGILDVSTTSRCKSPAICETRFPKRNSGTPGMSWGCLHVGRNRKPENFSLRRHPYYDWVFAMWSVGESYWVLDGRWFWCLKHVSWHFLVGANYSTWKQHGGRRAEQETNHIKNTN